MAKFSVIIPAAGKGERFEGREKKTFAKVDGRPVFLRTIEQFINRPDVCQTILVVAPEDVESTKSLYGANIAFLGVKFVEGGSERFDSVSAALAVVADEAEYIAVHDAVRPCVTSEMIDAVFAEAQKSGASVLGAPIVGTIKRAGDSMVIDETVSRDGLFEAQTPQVFRRDILLKAYKKADEAARAATDDAQVVELSGHPVTLVRSDPTNIKITTKADVTLAKAILKARPVKPVQRLGAFEEAQW